MEARERDPISGLTHLAGLVLGVAGGAWLLLRARHSASFWPDLAYVASLCALYAASSAYHLARTGAPLRTLLRRLDHSAIFLFIAGTSTPVFVRAFEGPTLAWMLGASWSLAIAGTILRMAWMNAPRALYTAMYVAMGWLVVVQARTAIHALPPVALALVAAGGVTYTLGALVYALKRPDPLPRVFGFHEIWHLFVMGGSTLHYAAIFVLT